MQGKPHTRARAGQSSRIPSFWGALWVALAWIAGTCPLSVSAQPSVDSMARAAAVDALPQDPGASGSLTGEVADPSGALIPGATVLVRVPGHHHDFGATSDNEGHFTLKGLPPGEYSFMVTAPGFQAFESIPFTLRAGEARRLETVTLPIPSGHADAYVTMNRKEIAGAELHAAEQQRIVGFPDFYTSFVWNAAPLDARQKLSLGLHATTDRMAFVTAGLVASAEQINNTFPEFGRGGAGFGKRYGAAYADGFTGKFLGGALLPSVFREDPRYFYMGPPRNLEAESAACRCVGVSGARRQRPHAAELLAHPGQCLGGGAVESLSPGLEFSGKTGAGQCPAGHRGRSRRERGARVVPEALRARWRRQC